MFLYIMASLLSFIGDLLINAKKKDVKYLVWMLYKFLHLYCKT